MTHPFQRYIVWVWVGFISACATLPSVPFLNEATTLLPQAETPATVVSNFLEAWSAQDWETAYALLSTQSRQLYPPEQWNGFYQNVHGQVGFSGLTYTLHETYLQGRSAAVGYDVVLQTDVFGEIRDDGRTIRLVQELTGTTDATVERWLIAWTPMDIFEGLTNDALINATNVYAPRGNILDRNNLPLVEENGTMIAIYAIQDNMASVEDCIALLSPLLHIHPNLLQRTFQNYLSDSIFYVGEIDTLVETENRTALQETCGFSREDNTLVPRTTRAYYGNGGAVHVTGYVSPRQESDNVGNRDLVGRSGIEETFDKELAGRPSQLLQIIADDILLRELGRTEGTPPQDVTLTLDRDLQLAAGRILSESYSLASGNWGSLDISPGAAIIMLEVNTGKILAMASYPTFSPGVYNPDTYAPNRGDIIAQYVNDTRNPLTNRVTEQQYSPGSVFKIVSTVAIANEQLIGNNDNFYCGLTWDGSTAYGDTFSPRSDWRLTDGLEATGDIVPSQALMSSCDPFYYEFGAMMFRRISANALVDYAEAFGFNRPTNLQFLKEVRGQIPVPPNVESAINNTIGQGDTQVTLLQTALMVAAVANGGTLYQPMLVEKIGTGEQISYSGEPTVVRELDYADEAWEVARAGMCGVVADPTYGTGYWVFNREEAPAPYIACGKTGTAQAGYAPHAWFAAYAPADNPEVVVVAVSQHSREGSEVAAPMVRRALDIYFDVPEVAPYPSWWWENRYVPLAVPENGVAGG
ncbi:MAG: penicillin-binding transpeptidase domain-containing protein [Phototrophicaceae bacterium]